MTLIGRDDELGELRRRRDLARRGVTQLVVMFGRRRVGKTYLLRHFATDVVGDPPVAYFPATREAAPIQRRDLVNQLTGAGVQLPQGAAESWAGLLEGLFDAARQRPCIVIVDEAPYLVESDRAWPSVLQRVWDAEQGRPDPSKLLLILNGSAVSTMTSMISSRGALFERPSSTLRIEPFTLPMTHELLGNPNPATSLEAHAACGGYPLLLSRWRTDAGAIANLTELAGQPFGPLVANANSLMLDIADTGGHHMVLGAIGRGASKLSEISSRAGRRAEHSLDVLRQAGFVGRRTPLGEPARKNLHYDLLDGYLRFWFAIVDRNIQLIESGQGLAVVNRSVPLWTRHLADTFEREARAHAVRLVALGVLEPGLAIGEWWRDSGGQGQVDVVGLGYGRWSLAGEAKWADCFGRSDLGQLERNIETAGRRDDRPSLASWSRHGPTDDVRMLRPTMRHFTVDDMVEKGGVAATPTSMP
jgi:AAA+ ATPase superfamily predicted ATPase